MIRPVPGAVDALASTAAARRLVAATAEQIARDAASLAPVKTGVLRDSYKATKARSTPTGVVATAFTDSAIGHIVEWGSIERPAIAPLRRAAARTGLRTRLAQKGTG